MIKHLLKLYLWEELEEDAAEIFHNCHICQQESLLIKKTAYKNHHPEYAFHTVSINAVRSFPTSSGRKTMLLVAIDNLTKWVEALLVARIDKKTTTLFILNYIIFDMVAQSTLHVTTVLTSHLIK